MSSKRVSPEACQSGRWPWDDDVVPVTGRVDTHSVLTRITVITPSYNQGAFLEETIRSVLGQNYPNLQYIVVDGGSTDESHQILDRYESQIDHVIREPDRGQSDAIGKGLALADGEWFNWINSDDRLEPGTLWELARCVGPKTDLLAFRVKVEDANGNSPVDQRSMMYNSNLSALSMLRCDDYSFSQPGLWFRMDHLRDCGGINPALNYGFDWDLLVRYLAMFPHVTYSDHVGAMFRLHDQSKTVVELSKADVSENRFQQENDCIRNQLESSLSPGLAKASRLGRRRKPWNDRMVAVLDQLDRSPAGAAWQLSKEIWQDPAARVSWRTVGAIGRLLSRYVRPSFWK
ncbi:glycosyltransferase family 2 protein [Neorhodopirellula pilleata]|uniref:Poly-beta-1,6-N-acetyl-D-glucosamine synthase n=1 Tax=Neorhodopirellula pilleata TaxID=2714738 RepID=A0A5C6API4_9BACT|nr:glycosyltransferase family 2 protein [Neorhodopirellula pilleata]TWU01341.1 Poly-beta-1,6-N-acetyl-D-glucosamine synthase [Neorhodopirellula pilleata]